MPAAAVLFSKRSKSARLPSRFKLAKIQIFSKCKKVNDGNIPKQRFFEAVDSLVLTLAFMTLQNVKSGFPSNSNWGRVFDLSNWDHFITELKTLFQSILLKFLNGEKNYSSEQNLVWSVIRKPLLCECCIVWSYFDFPLVSFWSSLRVSFEL